MCLSIYSPKISQILPQRYHLSLYQPPLQASNSPIAVHKSCERSKTHSSYVDNCIACIDEENCEIGQDTYETFSMASQGSLEISNASGHTEQSESEDDTTQGWW